MNRLSMVASLALFVALVLATAGTAQESKEKAATPSRWSGVIVRLNKDASTLTVRRQHIEKDIHFDASTKWTKQTKGGIQNIDMAEFKDGSRVICIGNYNDEKQFVATRIDLREPHMMP